MGVLEHEPRRLLQAQQPPPRQLVRVHVIRHIQACTTDIPIQNDCAHAGLSLTLLAILPRQKRSWIPKKHRRRCEKHSSSATEHVARGGVRLSEHKRGVAALNDAGAEPGYSDVPTLPPRSTVVTSPAISEC